MGISDYTIYPTSRDGVQLMALFIKALADTDDSEVSATAMCQTLNRLASYLLNQVPPSQPPYRAD